MYLKDSNNFTVEKANAFTTARTINGTSFNGSANITTANWGTARTLTIGNTGKSVNGSGNVSWSLSEIGAAASSHTHSYLPLSGGTMTGNVTFSDSSEKVLKSSTTNMGIFFNGSTKTIGFYDWTNSMSIIRYFQDTKQLALGVEGSTVKVNGPFYGKNSIALDRATLWLQGYGGNVAADYMRFGTNLMASAEDVVYFSNTSGNRSRIDVHSVKINGSVFVIGSAAPSSPATGDVWIQI